MAVMPELTKQQRTFYENKAFYGDALIGMSGSSLRVLLNALDAAETDGAEWHQLYMQVEDERDEARAELTMYKVCPPPEDRIRRALRTLVKVIAETEHGGVIWMAIETLAYQLRKKADLAFDEKLEIVKDKDRMWNWIQQRDRYYQLIREVTDE